MSETQISVPKITANLTTAQVEVGNTPQKVLFVGPMISGTGVTGSLVENINNEKQEDTLYGSTSQIASAIRAFKKINPKVSVDAIGLINATGATFTEFTITFIGTAATEEGRIYLDAGGVKNGRFSYACVVGTTNTQIRDHFVSALNARPTSLFVAAAVSTGGMTLTATCAGAQANALGVEVSGIVAGIRNAAGTDLTVVRTVTGATEPATTATLDVIGTNRYQGIVWGFTDVTAPVTLLNDRFNVNYAILDGVCFHAFCGSANDTITQLALPLYNSQSLVVFCDKDIIDENSYRGPAINEPWFDKTAQFAAVRALRLTDGASVSQYLTSQSGLDQFGGTALASLPYFNTPFPNLSPPKSGRGWINMGSTITGSGGSLLGINSAGVVVSGEIVTTYKTDAASNPDPTWKFLNAVDTMSNAREYIVNNWRKRFAQSRLTTGASVRGRSMVNRAMFKAYTISLFNDLTGPDFVLGVGGEDALEYFKQNLTVDISMVSGTILTTMSFPLVVGLRTILATIRVSFTTEN